MARMCSNDGVRQAQKALGNNSRDFEPVEVFLFYFAKNSAQCALYSLCSDGAKKHRFHFRRDKKEIPSRITNLGLEREAVQCFDDTPDAGVVVFLHTFLQVKRSWPFRHQDRSNLYIFVHQNAAASNQLSAPAS